ncbi:5-formyltetrahydrofolate cyclo-ligase [Halorhodospira neutriphila]|uniref:5-formyltetrahydrofolate cyclo-ligase n=1 Tax=Halorhodospira neutriphila TaxID=168379 RepID=UPI001907575C
METKGEMRRRLRRRRREILPSYRRAAERRVAAAALAWVRRCQARRVACYLDADGEIPTRGVLQALQERGTELYLPALGRGGRALEFRRHRPGGPLRPNRYGLPEPPPSAARSLPPGALGAVFLPLVAFDAEGRRLGMGGGYYDATFAFLRRWPWRPPQLVGLAYACQQVAQVPGAQWWDVPLQGVITERGCAILSRRSR